MLFNSVEFIFVFLPVVLLVFYLLGNYSTHRVAISWLVGASLFFYGWWNPVYLGLILASILFNYAMGAALAGGKGKPHAGYLLAAGVFCNLAVLAYFKYANFFVENFNTLSGASYHLETIILPLAISFFTFQQVTFLVDASRGETREYNFLHYCLFVTFFPQLIAGPIVHHREMLPQFAKDSIYRVKQSNLGIGLAIFLLGLFKKVVLADGVSAYATPVFDAAESGAVITFFEAWAGGLAYTFQLYFDFSGYSDMAIGIARMFNINLPLNFNSPYKAVSIIEFWRRWHMTLSRFLRDYLYFPLGGNRKGKSRRYTNLMITMLLGGLWHGAGWTFIAWGFLHGIYLVINHAWHAIRGYFWNAPVSSGRLGCSVSWTITFLCIVVSWVVFRAESFSGAMSILQGMSGMNGFILPAQIAVMIPGLERLVDTVGTMPLLGGGTVMGVFEMAGMFLLMFALIAMPASHEMKPRLLLLALVGSFYFTLQAVLFSRAPSEFLYFQF